MLMQSLVPARPRTRLFGLWDIAVPKYQPIQETGWCKLLIVSFLDCE